MKKKLLYVDIECEVGDRVFWRSIVGDQFEGTLIRWDNESVAIIKMDDDTEREVQC